jgi:hypothetical protein
MKEGARYDVYDTIVWRFYRFGLGSLSSGEMGDLSSRKLNPNFSSPPLAVAIYCHMGGSSGISGRSPVVPLPE